MQAIARQKTFIITIISAFAGLFFRKNVKYFCDNPNIAKTMIFEKKFLRIRTCLFHDF